MGWLRLVCSSNLQVSFAEYSLFYKALLQKRPVIVMTLRVVATPYRSVRRFHLWNRVFIFVYWRIHICGMTCPYVCTDVFIFVQWRIHMCVLMYSYLWNDMSVCVCWLVFVERRIHMCVLTYSYLCNDMSVCVYWRIYMRHMTHSYSVDESYVARMDKWHNSFIFIFITRCIHVAHAYVWHDSSIIRMKLSYAPHDAFA